VMVAPNFRRGVDLEPEASSIEEPTLVDQANTINCCILHVAPSAKRTRVLADN